MCKRVLILKKIINIFMSNMSSQEKITKSWVTIDHYQFIILDIGLNLIIFDNKIHKTDVITHNITPPHPKSNDHDVENILDGIKSNIFLLFCNFTTPSILPSASILGLLCIRLKCMIVNVNRANDARKCSTQYEIN